MAITNIVTAVPPAVVELVQQGLIERAFHDGLFPALLYRAEAQEEEWVANTGTEIFMTRAGLMNPITTPLATNADPLPQTVNFEQWVAKLQRYGGAIDTHVPTSAVANADLFVRNIHQLGLQAGQSLNRIPRNFLYQRYLGGQTCLIAAANSGDTSIRVASVNGFTDVIVKGSNVAPKAVSASSPQTITIAGVSGTLSVIGFDLDDPTDANGPGTLYLSAAVGGSGAALRAAVLAADRPLVIRVGGGNSVDAIGPGDILTYQDILSAISRLRGNNVLPHESGDYNGHINVDANQQVYADPAWQRLFTAMPESEQFQNAFIGRTARTTFYENVENPDSSNSGNNTSTGTNSVYSSDIGAETINASGVRVGRVIITGRGCLVERRLDERIYVTEAGVTGKEGEFSISNQGVEIQTEGIRLLLRAPINRLLDQVSAAWSISTAFAVPSDISSGGPQRYKRAVVIEHALES